MKKGYLFIAIALLLAGSVDAYTYYYDPQYGSYDSSPGRSFGNVFDFLGADDLFGFYQNHQYTLDFLIFLAIFMGLARVIYGRSFERGHVPITVGVSLALAFGIVMWEQRNLGGSTIIKEFAGSYGVIVLILAGIIALIALIARLAGHRGIWSTFFILLAILCWLLIYNAGWAQSMSERVGFDVLHAASILVWPFTILAVIFLAGLFRRGNQAQGGGQ